MAMLRHARRRQRRSSAFSTGCSGSGLNRKLSATAANTKNNSPDENFESRAPASTRPNFTIVLGEGERHIFGSCQTVSTQNNVTAMSVITSGPKERNAGMVTKAERQIKPPQEVPSRAPQI